MKLENCKVIIMTPSEAKVINKLTTEECNVIKHFMELREELLCNQAKEKEMKRLGIRKTILYLK